MMFSTHLKVQDLACRRGGRLIFSGVDLTLAPGDAALVTGPNGAGKSTLLRTLGGLIAPDKGSIDVGDPDGNLAEASHLIGHLEAIKPGLSLSENLAFYLGLLSTRGAVRGAADIEARMKLALSAVNLAQLADRPARFLSAGQKRRLALSRLIAVARPIWLLDEPTLGLDIESLGRLDRLLAAHRAQGGIVIAASHQPIGLVDAHNLQLEPAPIPKAQASADWGLS